MEKRLGRGLDSLLQNKSPRPEPGPLELPVSQLQANPFQPRTEFNAEGLEELVASIRQHGFLQPVVVRRTVGGFELISGERRLRAARAIGLERIPAIIREAVSDEDMLELALVENLQRQDLDPIEKAKGYRNLQTKLGLTQEQVSARVGLKRSTVANHLRLLDLPVPVQNALAAGQLQMGHARALLGLSNSDHIERFANQAIEEALSVRDVEALVRSQGMPPKAAQPSGASTAEAGAVVTAQSRSSSGTHGETPQSLEPAPPWVRDLERRLTESLGTRVEIKNRDQYQGQIQIHYHNRVDLERLIQRLAPKAQL